MKIFIKKWLIKKWLDKYGIKNYMINSKGEIDVDGDVDLSEKGLTKFPSFIQFRRVKGNFLCDLNRLTTLKGAPIEVGKVFDCSYNVLTSLEGASLKVNYFDCNSNKLTSLEGSPKEVEGNFYCYNNNLIDLKGAPETVGGDFACFENKIQFTEEDVRKVCKVKYSIYV